MGHSTRAVDDLAALLCAAGVTMVADVRTIARSRTNRPFNRERLPASLADERVGYGHRPAPAGLQKPRPSPDRRRRHAC